LSIRNKIPRASVLPVDSDSEMAPKLDKDAPQHEDRGLRHIRRMSHSIRQKRLAKNDAPVIITPTIRPQSQCEHAPTIAKSIEQGETITFDTVNPFTKPRPETFETGSIEKSPLPTLSPIDPLMASHPVAAQSTETLPDPAQFTYWQQYDRFIEQRQQGHFQQMQRQITPPQQQPQASELAEQKAFCVTAVTTTVIPSPSSATSSGRLGHWKDKLKTKLHV